MSGGGKPFGFLVSLGVPGSFVVSRADTIALCQPVGMIVDQFVAPGTSGRIQCSGIIEAEFFFTWDFLTGDQGGLVSGATYYLSDLDDGLFTRFPPTDPGRFITAIGRAVNALTLKLEISRPIGL